MFLWLSSIIRWRGSLFIVSKYSHSKVVPILFLSSPNEMLFFKIRNMREVDQLKYLLNLCYYLQGMHIFYMRFVGLLLWRLDVKPAQWMLLAENLSNWVTIKLFHLRTHAHHIANAEDCVGIMRKVYKSNIMIQILRLAFVCSINCTGCY